MSAQKTNSIINTLQKEKSWISSLVRSHLGLNTSNINWIRVGGKVERLLETSSLTVQDWLQCLTENEPIALSVFLNHETYWFRDEIVFECIKNNCLSNIFSGVSKGDPIRIWSAGCSTGQEIFSLMMLIHRYFPHIWEKKIFFLATDISAEVLDCIRMGIYSEAEIRRGLPKAYHQRYFRSCGERGWEIQPWIRERLCVEQHDLQSSWLDIPKMDLIFLRNVRMYFTPEQIKLLDLRIWNQLDTNGVWVSGASELTIPDSKIWQKEYYEGVSWLRKRSLTR
jgi:chemotaxis protein methyltransferase CheR